MRRVYFLSFFVLIFAGCHNSSVPQVSTPVTPPGTSLAEMRARYSKMSDQYKADCLTGSPEHIKNTRALCEQKRERMQPLGNALMEAEAKAAQRATNP